MNGWANQESWALAMWLSNDVALYNMARDIANGEPDPIDAASNFKHWVEDLLWDELLGSPQGRLMTREVGSLHRVDWQGVTDSFRDE